jgi:iron complex outermembrane receptor protein
MNSWTDLEGFGGADPPVRGRRPRRPFFEIAHIGFDEHEKTAVLTAADIRRSGATCIPEALQLVPGLTVLQLDGRSWTVSIRGGARQYADKILVLIDGRSLFTPMFSGVIWDTINVPMEDIEQVEVTWRAAR